MGVEGGEVEVAASALRVEAGGNGDGLDDGRFARSVVSGQHGDGAELESVQGLDGPRPISRYPRPNPERHQMPKFPGSLGPF